MRRPHQQHPIFQPYSDVLLNVMGTLLLIVTILIMTVNVSKTKLDAHPHAEYLVTMEWDSKRNVDLDLWLQDPFNHIIYYTNREVSNISLDRDSRGYLTNMTTLPNGTTIRSDNREIIAIRAVIPGDYLVGASYYNGGDVNPDGGQGDNYEYGRRDPRANIDFKVRVEKVNPHMTTLFEQEFHFDHIKQSQNVAAFHVNDDGSVDVLPTPPGSMPADHGALQ